MIGGGRRSEPAILKRKWGCQAMRYLAHRKHTTVILSVDAWAIVCGILLEDGSLDGLILFWVARVEERGYH